MIVLMVLGVIGAAAMPGAVNLVKAMRGPVGKHRR